MTLTFFAEHVLWAWTGDMDVARKAAPVLALYALGNGILALSAFPYYLQYAKGDLKLHLIGNTLFVVLLVPMLIWATLHFGAIGAGYVWVGSNALYFLFWIPKVHKRFMKGLHVKWLLEDVLPIVLLSVVSAAVCNEILGWPQERTPAALEIGFVSMTMFVIAALGSTFVKRMIMERWRARFC
jgi:O-antigen/teichoic acid export membrane protein